MRYKGAEGPRGMAEIGRLTSNTVFNSYPLEGEWLSEDGISTLTDLKFKIVGGSSNGGK
jgi:hypothetical protein